MRKPQKCNITNICLIKNKDKILVLDRKKKDWPGLTFPGGHVEIGEDFNASVIREVKEETGLTIKNPILCGIEEYKNNSKYDREIMLYYKTDKFIGKIKSSKEGEVFWIERKDLDKYKLSLDLKRILKVIDVVSQRLSDYRNNLSIIHFNQKILQIIGMHYNTILSERTRISCEEKRLVNILSRGMLSVRNEYDNYNTIFECLKQLNIGNARLYLYEKPITSYMTQFTVLPNEVILKGSIINGKIIIPDDKILVKTDRIFSEKRLFSNCNEYVVNSVYSGTTQYGIFVCDLKYRDFVDLDFVSSQLGTVVNTINLVEKLDNLSKHDELTGLWNRRGFIDKVQGYMNINKGALIFVDLDGLKIINDTYGHEGGDEAIITGAKILKDAFDEFGVIGRIGGDEFAVFLPNQSDFALSEIDQLINDKTIYHNTLIKRNFKVELSYGISLFDQYQDLTVRELLDKADREMYCHKRNKKGNRRKKDVF